MITRFQYKYPFKDFIYSLNKINSNRNSFKDLETYFDLKQVYFAIQARVSLRLVLNSLNLKKNAVIGVQAYNCINVFESIQIAGYRPLFIDVNENYVLDNHDLSNKADRIDALILNHTFGIPADIDKIRTICKNKPIIEDCAHSLFSTYQDKPTGTFCDASIFSIGYAKYPSIGKGGFALLNNQELKDNYEKEHFLLKDQSLLNEMKNVFKNYFMAFANKPPYYNFFFYPLGKLIDKKVNITDKFGHKESKGFNSNACLLEHNFREYLALNEKQRANGKKLVTLLKDAISCVDDTDEKKINFYIFPLRSTNRDEIVSSLYKKGMECGKHFSNSLRIAKKFGYRDNMCPNSEKIVKEIFTIPSNYSLTDNQIELIVKNLKGVL